MKKIVFIAIAGLVFAACGGGGSNKKLPAAGAPYEVIVVASEADWRSSGLGDTIQSVLKAPVPHINNYEPQFDVYRIMPDNFVDVARRNGDVLIVRLGEKYKRAEMVSRTDEFATPQIVVYAVAPDGATLAAYIHEHGEQLRTMFNNVESQRWTTLAQKAPAIEIQGLVREKFGIGISLPNGFIVGKDADDFLWLRFRYPESDQELSIYSYEGSNLSLEGLINARDRFVSLIPGEVPDSHMITVREVAEPGIATVTIGNREWVEMRGLWEVKNDFMGGPFVSYSTVIDGRVLTIDGAVFSPSPYKMKRNLLRQLESIVHSVKIEG